MTINFSKQFYNLYAVKSATCAYKNLADFKIKTDKNDIKIEVESIDKDVKRIFKDEFCNFVLSEMKKTKFNDSRIKKY